MTRRPEFDPRRPLVASRGFIFAGKNFEKGDPFPIAGFNLRLIRQQYGARVVDHVFGDENTETQIQMTGPTGGRYTITAPWLEKPLVIRGKVKAEEALAEITEEGPPVGWVEGGSQVEVEEGGGGWYRFTAPWLDEPQKVQGIEAAHVLFAKLHEAGAPEPADAKEIEEVEYPASLVLITIADDKFEVSAPWLEAVEVYDEADDAEARQTDVREEGPPEGWEPDATPADAGTSDNDATAKS